MSSPKIPVLIVDDEESIHRALDRTLRREPFDLLHAFDAGEAEAVLEQRPDVRAVVCDHYMPGTPGLEFLLHLRRKRPGMIAILLTAQADIHMVITAINEGRLHRFFTKPWDGNELKAALRTLLHVDGDDPDALEAKIRDEDARLRASTVPRQDEDGAWVIEPPEPTEPA